MNILIDQNLNVQVMFGAASSLGINVINEEANVSVDGQSAGTGQDMSGLMNGAMPGAQPKDSLLTSWPFVIGISAATLAISIVLGILLAKKKIKKGFELYED